MKYVYLNKYWEINKDYNLDKLLYLMIDRPNYISNPNDFVWYNNKKQYHRDYDLPSLTFIYSVDETCNLHWFKNDKSHRGKSKPSYIRYDGIKQYYINNKFIKSEWLK